MSGTRPEARRFGFRPRLLPVLIIACFFAVGARVGGILKVDQQSFQAIAIESAMAAEPKAAEKDEASETDADKSVEPAEDSAQEPEVPAPAPVRIRLGDDAPFSAEEIRILENLSERREELDKRESEIALRENLMAATESRIDQKIAELKSLEKSVKGLLYQHEEQENKRLSNLVKIYENMKPKDAARIFEQLDVEILLLVAERMKEVKIAPILAKMNPAKAKIITVELATRRPIPTAKGG
jgi:flagellar motility protein MotE (MotC chaperone)